jgi:hypothetical protein
MDERFDAFLAGIEDVSSDEEQAASSSGPASYSAVISYAMPGPCRYIAYISIYAGTACLSR